MREIKEIIVHCSATQASSDIGAKEIRAYHVRENGWKDIGYHYVIRRNGAVEKGRDDAVVGAHVQGHNANSLGICLVGGITPAGAGDVNYTEEQYSSLAALLQELHEKYPSAGLFSHKEFAPKFCPGFTARDWWREYTGKQWIVE